MNIANTNDLHRCLDMAARELLLQNSITTEMDAEIAAIKAKYDPKIARHETERKALIAAAQDYATTHRKALLIRDLKSLVLGGHKLGWQDNGGAIKAAKGVTLKKITERLVKKGGPLARLFIRRPPPALDKDACSKRWDTYGPKLRALGLRFVKEEFFFVELDVTSPAANRQPGEPQA